MDAWRTSFFRTRVPGIPGHASFAFNYFWTFSSSWIPSRERKTSPLYSQHPGLRPYMDVVVFCFFFCLNTARHFHRWPNRTQCFFTHLVRCVTVCVTFDPAHLEWKEFSVSQKESSFSSPAHGIHGSRFRVFYPDWQRGRKHEHLFLSNLKKKAIYTHLGLFTSSNRLGESNNKKDISAGLFWGELLVSNSDWINIVCVEDGTTFCQADDGVRR